MSRLLNAQQRVNTTGKMSNEMGFSYDPTEYMNTLFSTCCFFNLPFFLDTNKRFITSRNSLSSIGKRQVNIGYLFHDVSSIETKHES